MTFFFEGMISLFVLFPLWILRVLYVLCCVAFASIFGSTTRYHQARAQLKSLFTSPHL